MTLQNNIDLKYGRKDYRPTHPIGRYATVGVGSVVTHDVPDYAIVVGSPAKVVRYLEKEKFPKD